jgi:hypothetical protein
MKCANWTLPTPVPHVLVNAPMTSALRRLLRPAATLLPALALGCAGGQTGEESGEPACRETRTALGAGEISPLGFGAEQVLATSSARSAPLEWLVTNPAYGPESGTAELTISLEPLGPAAFVQSRAPNGNEQYPCADRVEVDVEVTLATSGGALAETFRTKLRATDASVAEISHLFANGNVDGTLSFDTASLAGRKVKRITFEASFHDASLSGSLSAGIEQISGETASFQEPTIACFGGPTDRCPVR